MSDRTQLTSDNQDKPTNKANQSSERFRDEALDSTPASNAYIIAGNKAQLVNSEREKLAGTKLVSAAAPGDSMQVVVQLKSRASDAELDKMYKLVTEGKHAPLTDAEFEKQFGVDSTGLQQLKKFAGDNGLKMTDENTDTKSGVVVLQGTAAQMEKAFDVRLNNYKSEVGETFRSYEGKASVSRELAPYLKNDVMGLDSRKMLSPRYMIDPEVERAVNEAREGQFQPHAGKADIPKGRMPVDILSAYGAPKNLDGSGYNACFLSFGGAPPKGIDTYLQSQGVAPNSFSVINTTGRDLTPNKNVDAENGLDQTIIQEGLPKAHVNMIAGTFSEAGFLTAIDRATFPHPGDNPNGGDYATMSISWGIFESYWKPSAIKSIDDAFKKAAIKGMTVTVASGDNGAWGQNPLKKQTVDFPAGLDAVTAVGGTALTIKPDGTYGSETAWGGVSKQGASGGAIAEKIPRPDYQNGVNTIPPNMDGNKFVGRAVPDVALNATPNPSQAWEVYVGTNLTPDGLAPVGGTSASSPAWSVMAIKMAQELGKPSLGFLNPKLYELGKANSNAFHDVTTGTNTDIDPHSPLALWKHRFPGYSAGPGYDAVTGWGSINYPNMVNAFRSKQSNAADDNGEKKTGR